MNLCGHYTFRKAGVKARSPPVPWRAPVNPVGEEAASMRVGRRSEAVRGGGRSFGAPLPGAPNVGFRVPAKPLRLEHWGAQEDFPLPNLALSLAAISKLSSMNSQHKRHKIYTGSGHCCGVITYSSVVVVDCLLCR